MRPKQQLRCAPFRVTRQMWETAMATIADLNTQVAALTASVNALPAPTVPVATQADLDGLSTALTAAQAAVTAKTPTA